MSPSNIYGQPPSKIKSASTPQVWSFLYINFTKLTYWLLSNLPNHSRKNSVTSFVLLQLRHRSANWVVFCDRTLRLLYLL